MSLLTRQLSSSVQATEREKEVLWPLASGQTQVCGLIFKFCNEITLLQKWKNSDTIVDL